MFNDIVWNAKRNEELCGIGQKELKNTLKDFLAVIGLSLDLVQKRSGTANQTDVAIVLRRKECKKSTDLVIQYSVAPVPWKEEN